MYKSVTLYDAKLRDQNGNGYYTHNLKVNGMKDREINETVKLIRARQKKMNEDYRKKNKPIKKKYKKKSESEEDTDEEIEEIEEPQHSIDITYSKDIDLKLDSDTGNTLVLFGSSKAGKSTAMMRIYDKYYTKKFISTLYSTNPHINVYKNRDKILICNTFNKQTEKIVKMEKFINTKTDNHYNFLNMFDDVLDVRYNKLINNMIMTYRNSNISTIMALQYVNLLNKSARSNLNAVCCFRFNTDESIEGIINMFLKGYFSKMGLKNIVDQINFYKEVTKDHGFIYLHPTSDTITFHRLIL